jgi:hypothetical protein
MAKQFSKAQIAVLDAAMRDPSVGYPLVELALIEAEADRIESNGAMTPAVEQALTRKAQEAAGRAQAGMKKFFGG